MSPSRDRRLIVAGVVALVVAIAGASLVLGTGTQPVLVVTDDDGDTLHSVPVSEGEPVVLEYTHSVENSTVRDVYEVHASGLAITYTEFSSFGAGLPSHADVERTEDGLYRHELPGDDPGIVHVSPGEIAGHELVVGGERIDLVRLGDGGNVILRVETTSRIPIF